jgi:3-hydroxyisobutyrate dehydrogenase-like beta-hydroxyacid dehydrogenase
VTGGENLETDVIGFLGFGEVAYAFARDLHKKGCRVFAYDHNIDPQGMRGSLKQKRARETGARLSDDLDEVIKNAHFILSTVTPGSAEKIAMMVLPKMSHEQMFLDLNAAAPALKERLGDAYEKRGLVYVDCALLGSAIESGLEAPIVVSGCPESLLQCFEALFNLQWIGTRAGQAAAVKMCQSIITKGYQALIWEQSMLAKIWEVEELVDKQLSAIFDRMSFLDWRRYALSSGAIHAGRRAEEMDMVMETLREANLPRYMSQGAKETLVWLASKNLRDKYHGERPENTEEVVDTVISMNRSTS